MKISYLIAGALGTLLCLVATAAGLFHLLHAGSALGYILTGGLAIILVILLLNSRDILSRDKPVHPLVLIPWWIALVTVGSAILSTLFQLFLNKFIAGDSALDLARAAVLACFAVFLLAGSPVVVSYVIPDLLAEEDDDDGEFPEAGDAVDDGPETDTAARD